MGKLHDLLRRAVHDAQAKHGLSQAEIAAKAGCHRVTLLKAMNPEQEEKALGAEDALTVGSLAGWTDQQKVDLLTAWLEDRAGKDPKAGMALEYLLLYLGAKRDRGSHPGASLEVLRAFARGIARSGGRSRR